MYPQDHPGACNCQRLCAVAKTAAFLSCSSLRQQTEERPGLGRPAAAWSNQLWLGCVFFVRWVLWSDSVRVCGCAPRRPTAAPAPKAANDDVQPPAIRGMGYIHVRGLQLRAAALLKAKDPSHTARCWSMVSSRRPHWQVPQKQWQGLAEASQEEDAEQVGVNPG